ncbi:MAG: dihydropteroate synthase [Deltaproteobacteria bacterium]
MRRQSEPKNNIDNDDMSIKYRTLAASPHTILKCRDRELPLHERTHIMGVLNLTPDSFYDGGRYFEVDLALKRAEKMIEEGADIVDIGGESTRPGSEGISEEEEITRVIPVIREIYKRFDIVMSVDTTKPRVAREALDEGVSVINDISGLKFDDEIAELASRYGAALVLMHTTSRPRDMQKKTQYASLIDDVMESLQISVNKAIEKGVGEDSILVDPGIGFGKTAEQNLILLKHLNRLGELGKPVLIGTSNKSFIGHTLGTPVNDRTEGTAATVAIAILNGASVIRVHDVAYMKRVSRMADAVSKAN